MRFTQNITAFLMTQNHQFEESIRGLNYAKESLDPARFISSLSNFDRLNIFCRLRNHDLLTSLDVLTAGSYLRLPTIIKVLPTIMLCLATLDSKLQNSENGNTPHSLDGC